MGKKKRKYVQPERSNEELVILIQQGDDSYIEQLLRQNEPFVHAILSDMEGIDRTYEKDYMQAGRMGLLYSVTKFDPSYGKKFLTYAGYWIRKEMYELRKELTKQQMEIPLADFDNEEGRASVDRFIRDGDSRGLENRVLRDLRTKVIHSCLDAMGPRERQFAMYRYGFCDVAPMGRESISQYFHLPMHEVLRLEECVKQYVLESLDVDDVLEFFGEESIDPDEGGSMAREAYENLFSEPAGDYLTNLVNEFQTNWQYECEYAM